MDPCDLGIYLKDECHKLTYTRKIEQLDFNLLPEDDMKVLIWRAGIDENN